MTPTPGATKRPNLNQLLDGGSWRWVYTPVVLGYPPAFQKLGPYVGPGNRPDGSPKIPGGAHFLRTLPPIEDAFRGLRTPAVERLIAAHIEHGVTPGEVADTTRWATTLMRLEAADLGWTGLDETIQDAGLKAGRILGASAIVPMNLKEAEDEIRRFFGPLILMPNMREAFWDVLSWPKIREMLPENRRSDEDVLAYIRQYLPRPFVNQFQRAG